MQTITPFLWFNNNAEEAMNFYTSIFKNSKGEVTRAGGSVISVTFELNGQKFMGLNGGPIFGFTPAISFFVNCETQAEVDEYWEKLTAGGKESRCGWLVDKFGLSWQIVPSILSKLINSSDREKAQRALEAMFQMNKLDIAKLQAAYDGN
jgi:predicted 3-demethylubiquinone-9 3-methyltransferase (glyoxalase superfamily)